MTTQQAASIIRQVVAVAASVVGVLSANGTILQHLPPAVQAILTAAAPVLFSVEHFVGDPSTGTPVVTTTTTAPLPSVPDSPPATTANPVTSA